jgi:hypothetical protein
VGLGFVTVDGRRGGGGMMVGIGRRRGGGRL